VGGCEHCRAATIRACKRAGFSPRIAHNCDDTVIVQSLVGAGMGVAIVNGLALRAHKAQGVHATQLTDTTRQIYAATYGDPPDPPATAALIEILASLA
jgi:DNA-binding transcriptional LysR family regulator